MKAEQIKELQEQLDRIERAIAGIAARLGENQETTENETTEREAEESERVDGRRGRSVMFHIKQGREYEVVVSDGERKTYFSVVAAVGSLGAFTAPFKDVANRSYFGVPYEQLTMTIRGREGEKSYRWCRHINHRCAGRESHFKIIDAAPVREASMFNEQSV